MPHRTRPFGRATVIFAAMLIVGVVPGVRAQSGQAPAQIEVPPQGSVETRIVPLHNDATTVRAAVVTNMTYHGGAVQHRQKVFQVFWQGGGPAFPAGYQTTINQFVQDLSSSPYYAVGRQYTDATGNIDTDVLFGGTWLDTTNVIPHNPPTVQDIADEANRAIVANGWAVDANSYVEVYTPSGYGVTENYCGYHVTATNIPFGLILFPASHGTLGTCIPAAGPFPNGQIVDHAIDVTAHEILETVTDPFGAGWFYLNGGGEIGDLCNFSFGARAVDGSNVSINGRHYLVQQEWSNAVSGCTLSTPLATITANGSAGPLTLAPNSSLAIAIAANGGDSGFANPEALYFGVATPTGLVWVTSTGGSTTPSPFFTGPLSTFGPTTLINIPNVSTLSPGTYAWVFIVNGSTGFFYDVVVTTIP